VSTNPTQILAEVSELFRSLSDGLLPGEEITRETRLIEDLGLESIALANLSGRIQSKYGPAANMVPFLAGRDQGPISNLRVGEVVEYLTSVLDDAEAVADAGGPTAGNSAGPPDLERCIIISTGRCGSTLLSDLIAEEPETISVSESLMTILEHLALAPRTELTGAEYWALLESPAATHLLKAGIVTEEHAYPDSGRWGTNKSALPAILGVCLPKLSADPDHLFDVLAVKVPHFPAQPVGLHHRMLLDLLATMHDRCRWVERTGASSSAAHAWLATCPDAKIIYLTRHVADTARSMSRHPAYQLAAIRHELLIRYGANPYLGALAGDVPDAAELPEEMRRLLPDRLTEQTLRELELGLGYYEDMCTQMNRSAEQALADLRPRHLHRMRYEDLVARPVDELTRVGSFLGFADPSGWAARTAPRVRSPRISST
jgi:putative sulfotransferase